MHRSRRDGGRYRLIGTPLWPHLGMAMTTPAPEVFADLQCHRCGYDLRAHPQNGKCPECGESVAESRRLGAIPRRPAWRDSDPRWRRRMLAGAWLLALLPLLDALKSFGWFAKVPVPNIFDFRENVCTLDETLFIYLHQPLIFCMGIVLLFSKERGRRHGPLDWTRRWGVICSYVILLLSAADILLVAALVLAGVAGVLLSIPLEHQPGVTQFIADVSSTYLRYGPNPKEISAVVQVVFSSIVILLACVPLFNALRSSGPKWIAAILLAPLALFSLMHVVKAGLYELGISNATPGDIYYFGLYFSPALLMSQTAGLFLFNISGSMFTAFLIEATKWGIVVATAVWLSIAQIAAWRRGKQ